MEIWWRPFLWSHACRTFKDEVFLEVALAGNAQCLVTGNLRHYPQRNRHGVRVVSPAEFPELFRDRGESCQ